jgi:hypothetical protein
MMHAMILDFDKQRPNLVVDFKIKSKTFKHKNPTSFKIVLFALEILTVLIEEVNEKSSSSFAIVFLVFVFYEHRGLQQMMCCQTGMKLFIVAW